MMTKKFRRVRIAATLVAAASLLVPADAQAFFGLCQKRQNAAAALYGGTVCNPCGQQLVCNYVPQTCYRTQTVSVPVQTMRPVCGTDPCTGCRTTVMRPVTTYQQQVQYVPYSSYRLQYSIAQPACPTATTSYYAPSVPSSGIVTAPATTYATPAPTYAAPASGCSSCNSGAAVTSYYAPATSYPVTTNYAPLSTTRMLAPGVVVPGGAAVAPATTAPYSYPTTQGNVSVGSYSYASPGASGIAPPTTYGSNYGSSSFTPAASAPASAGPSYAAPSYNGQTYAPSSSVPSSSAPIYSVPATAIPVSPSPTYATPAPTLSGSNYGGSTSSGSTLSGSTLSGSTLSGSGLNGTVLSSASPSATAGSSYYPPSSGVVLSSPSTSAGPMTPVPQPTSVYSSSMNPTSPTLSSPSGSAPMLIMPAPSATPTRSPYSSGVAPSGASPSGTGTPALPMDPIPDNEINRSNTEINGELRTNRTSTPALIDPEDKTAMALPVRRAWDYRVVVHAAGSNGTGASVMQANHTTVVTQPELPPTYAASSSLSSSLSSSVSNTAPATTARLGIPQQATQVQVMYAPQQQPMRRTADQDGWSASSR